MRRRMEAMRTDRDADLEFSSKVFDPQLLRGANQLGMVSERQGLVLVSDPWVKIGPCCKRETNAVVW